MKSDYVVRLTGQDDLSQTIKNVKKELLDTGKATSQIDKINDKFEKITKSTAPLKRQLRDLQNLMAQMNFDGLADTDTFTKIAEEAGRIKDAIGDASQATRQFSSDTMKLDAVIQAFQGIAAATSIATGAMALFGTENQDVKKAILQVQGALSVLNGVQSLANMLNKDSALMLRVKQIRLAATTAAEGANTVAVGANTVAVAANTAAQKAWNVAKAIGKALFGDWTGILLVGTAALSAYSVFQTKSADEQEKLNNETKEGEDIQKNYTNALSSTFGRLMTSYKQLEVSWKSLSNVQEKNKWITENKSKLEELGIAANNINEVEAAFSRNTPKIIQAFKQRAEMAAITAKMNDLYSKKMQLEDELQEKLLNRDVTGISELEANIKKVDADIDDAANRLLNLTRQLPKITTSTASPKVTKTVERKTTKSTVKEDAKKEDEIADSVFRARMKNEEKRIKELQQLREKYNNLERSENMSSFDRAMGNKGSIQSRMNLNDTLIKNLRELMAEYDKLGLKGSDAYKKIADELLNVSIKQGELATQAQTQNFQQKKIEQQSEAWGYYAEMVNGVGNALTVLGDSQEAQMAQFAVNTAAILANATSTIMAMNAEAMAKGASSAFSLPFPYNLAAWAVIASTIGSIFSSLPKFAEGGIVGGGSTHGDTILARLNTGEMIFSKRQQKNLFNLLDNGGVGGYTESTVRIKGSDLYLTMKNYKGLKNKTGLKTF